VGLVLAWQGGLPFFAGPFGDDVRSGVVAALIAPTANPHVAPGRQQLPLPACRPACFSKTNSAWFAPSRLVNCPLPFAEPSFQSLVLRLQPSAFPARLPY